MGALLPEPHRPDHYYTSYRTLELVILIAIMISIMPAPTLRQDILDLYDSCREILDPIANDVSKGQPPYKFELELAEVSTLLFDFLVDFKDRKEVAAKKICKTDVARCAYSADVLRNYTGFLRRRAGRPYTPEQLQRWKSLLDSLLAYLCQIKSLQ
ncbi:hypothetical protein EJ06DRAFT_64821 [Trichodelitschia bisporula]|uniref:Uncharacterized protein n=1 Tax=Trichodelitschia bisporula TaxID=703511 RepID=A0A6G1HSU3_9PEZI|nr:hypothetical protein EJ06DRAFT_64821 [Trichodelitschia bisporula]